MFFKRFTFLFHCFGVIGLSFFHSMNNKNHKLFLSKSPNDIFMIFKVTRLRYHQQIGCCPATYDDI